MYAEYIKAEGGFDERLFLKDDADNKLGTPIKASQMATSNGVSASQTDTADGEVSDHVTRSSV